jgi:hypothetical protein
MPSLLPADLAKVDPGQAWQPWEPGPAQPWSAAWAAHLYRRAAFGASPAEIQLALKDGCNAAVDRLLKPGPETAARDETLADLGEDFAIEGNAFKLRGWWLYGMLNGGYPLREKLTLFWHNHFATSIGKVRSPLLMYRQNELLRKHALGSFRGLLSDISHDVAMLIWLDSNQNVKSHPNENYAREVMELFSLGVGNYTEKDVQEAARAFTGWHADPEARTFAFQPAEHDDGVKTFLGRSGPWNGDDVLRIILEQPAAARFLVGKLYRDFVSEAEPPKALLAPLEERLRKSDFNIADLIGAMLRSRLFYSEHAYLKRIKAPVEFVLGAVKSAWTGPLAPGSAVPRLEAMGQALFEPPNVKGWPGGKAWLNNATLLARNNFAEWVALQVGRGPVLDLSGAAGVVAGGFGASVQQERQSGPPPAEAFDCSMYARGKKAATAKEIVAALSDQFVAGALNAKAAAKLEAFLADGKPKEKALDERIREAAHALMCMPEYHLC